MQASELYSYLEKDFIKPGLSDDWAAYMNSVYEFLTENFRSRSMGLVCDFTDEINQVFTAVFPSPKIMNAVLDKEAHNAMLFVHHPSVWDISKDPVFYQMDTDLLKMFREKNIAVYNLHVPLDNYGEYSTSVSFARALNIEPVKPFAPYFGALAGVKGRTSVNTVKELHNIFEKAVGHKTALYDYGENIIRNRTAALVAGGGLIEAIEEAAENNINLFITGISVKNEHSAAAHEFAQKNKISILGGTHYSTEKFACQAMVKYFNKLGLPSEFMDDDPGFKDL